MEIRFVIAATIDLVAIYAAVVSTLVLLWQIFTWLHSGARLKVFCAPNMKMYGRTNLDGNYYTMIDVTNTGNADTTITHVLVFSYKNILCRIRRKPARTSLINHAVSGYPIPYVLKPGQKFTSIARQDEDFIEMSKSGMLYAGVQHSLSRHPIMARLETVAGDRFKTAPP